MTIGDEIESFEELNKELRRTFSQLSWKIVEASSDQETLQFAEKLRLIASALKNNDQLIRDAHAVVKESLSWAEREDSEKRKLAMQKRRDKLLEDAEIKRQRHEANESLRVARLERGKVALALSEKYKSERELAELEKLAIEEKRSKIIRQAISTGSLLEVVETRDEELMNQQRRSGGGVIRIESGSGK